MATSAKRPLAVFLISKLRRLGDFIFKVNKIRADIAANATLFATPDPALATVATDVAALLTAQTNVDDRVPGALATRNAAYTVVLTDIRGLQGYVQRIADNAANEEQAKIVVTSSGFDLKVNGVYEKPPLVIREMITPGMIKLVAKSAAKRASYEWQLSINNGALWTNLPSTLKASTVVSGLASGTRYVYRFRSITKNGISAWSTTVSIVIQ